MNTKIISFEKNSLTILKGNEKKITYFQTPIEGIEQFDQVLVVMIYPEGENFLNENIFGVSYDGEILWQIKPIKHSDKRSPYVGIFRKGNYVKIYNWNGKNFIIDPNTGEAISEGYNKINYCFFSRSMNMKTPRDC
jgi:hypothetical protein